MTLAQEYSAIHYDSRKVSPNSIFVAIKGEASDGHDYIKKAASNGASKIIVQADVIAEKQAHFDELFTSLKAKKAGLVIEAVKDSREALAIESARFYQDPSNKLTCIGVTGTNGKTTVTHLIQALLQDCALLGTMGLKANTEDDYLDLGNTTPQSTEVQKILADQVQANKQYLAMEVSSHALEQHRVTGINYKTSLVTNLTQDHLDYHITMENYFNAKAKLADLTAKFFIVNLDDNYGEEFEEAAKQAKPELTILTTAIKQAADIQASNINYSIQGTEFILKISEQAQGLNPGNQAETKISLRLNGEFNTYNTLSAIAVALTEGISTQDIATTLAKVPPIHGRFDLVQEGNSPACIIDYAHSPDGLENILKGAQDLIDSTGSKGKLICIFGCGGDRDITKRPLMAKIAEKYSDEVYVTSDNPRTEDPEQIIADILTGISDLSKTTVISDRAKAIQAAIQNATKDDTIVVAGKGHENYQILKNETIHFDDKEEVLKAFH